MTVEPAFELAISGNLKGLSTKWRLVLVYLYLAFLLPMSCSPYIRAHNPQKAAQKAAEYLKIALVKRNLDSSYTFLSPKSRQNQSLGAYVKLLRDSHKLIWPTKLQVTGYEPIDNFKFLLIYAYGQDDTATQYYRLLMDGSAVFGYSVATVQFSDTSFTHLTKAWEPLSLE